MKKPAPRVILALAEDLGPLFPGETVAFVQAHVGWYLHTDGGSVVADLFGTEEFPNIVSRNAIGPFRDQGDFLDFIHDWAEWGVA